MERAQRPLRRSALMAVAMVVGAVFPAGAQAAPVNLDLTFSGDGTQTTDFGPNGVALTPNGKIVAVGEGIGASQTGDFALARYVVG